MLTRAAVDQKRRAIWPLELAVQMLDIEDDQDDQTRENVFGKLLLSFGGCDEEKVSWSRECKLDMG